MIRHDCNYYCRGDRHCELIYTSLEPRDWAESDQRYVTPFIRDAYRDAYDQHVVSIEPAREAPQEPPYKDRVQLAGRGLGAHAYLVYIEER